MIGPRDLRDSSLLSDLAFRFDLSGSPPIVSMMGFRDRSSGPPGIGIELNEEAFEHYPPVPYERPPLIAPDGGTFPKLESVEGPTDDD